MPSGGRQSVSSFRPKTPSRTPGDSGGAVSSNSRPVTPTSATSLPVQKVGQKVSISLRIVSVTMNSVFCQPRCMNSLSMFLKYSL